MYKGFLEYVVNSRGFLVSNERCTPWDVNLPFVPCLFEFIQHAIPQYAW